MKLNQGNKNNKLAIPAGKKKVVVMVVLIVIMAVMWIKVFSTKPSVGPVSALADIQVDQQLDKQELEMLYIQLPVVQGRNDTLTRDIFDAQSTDAFPWNGNARIGKKSSKQGGSQIQKVADSITLGAIIAAQKDRPREAFIESKLVSVGSKLRVTYQGEIFEFTVAQIDKNKVVLKWKDVTITKKMSSLNHSQN